MFCKLDVSVFCFLVFNFVIIYNFNALDVDCVL